MSDRERRSLTDEEYTTELRAGLTHEQLATLHTMEQFRWQLRFVRRPLFKIPVPVMFNHDGSRYAVLEGDGTFNEDPDFKIRP